MYFAFLFKKQNQKALCTVSLEKGSHRPRIPQQLHTLLCSREKVLAFVLCNPKTQLMCTRTKIALKPSFCLLNYGLCQEPTQPRHYCRQPRMRLCLTVQVAGEWCPASEQRGALARGCLGINASGFTFCILDCT